MTFRHKFLKFRKEFEKRFNRLRSNLDMQANMLSKNLVHFRGRLPYEECATQTIGRTKGLKELKKAHWAQKGSPGLKMAHQCSLKIVGLT